MAVLEEVVGLGSPSPSRRSDVLLVAGLDVTTVDLDRTSPPTVEARVVLKLFRGRRVRGVGGSVGVDSAELGGGGGAGAARGKGGFEVRAPTLCDRVDMVRL
jgi:hypothetical protein